MPSYIYLNLQTHDLIQFFLPIPARYFSLSITTDIERKADGNQHVIHGINNLKILWQVANEL